LRFTFAPHTAAALALLLLTTACAGSASGGGNGDDKAGNSPSQENWLTGPVDVGGKNDQPGFNQHTDHKDFGFEYNLARYLGKKLDFEPQIVDVPSKDRIAKIQSGQNKLVIATFSITDKRADKVDFVGPYFVTDQGFLVRDGMDINKLSDLKDKTVCTAEGSTSASKNLLPKSVHLKQEQDFSHCVKRVQREQMDAVFTDMAILYGFTQKYKGVHVSKLLLGDRPNRYGIAIAKHHKKDCERLRTALLDYLDNKWVSDYQTELRNLSEAFSDGESKFRPDPSDVQRYTTCTK
jgi:glutamate transport system substrate-binding protein